MNLLITGAAGFIGFHLAKYYLERGEKVIGIDNLNDYYEVSLKEARLQQLQAYKNFVFYPKDISNLEAVHQIFKVEKPQVVVNLAAQAGVRYSLTHPHVYVQSNIVGFTNIIEACRIYQIEHLLYASTSSVYGADGEGINREEDAANAPLTIYAASKKANELIAHAYSQLYPLKTTGLRFFTVYGPWGRPDMAFFSFTRKILAGEAIPVYNFGNLQRDFTYIDDIVRGIALAMGGLAGPHDKESLYKIYNIGFGSPVNLLDYIEAIEEALDKKAIKEYLPMQAGDVFSTHADISLLQKEKDYQPRIHYKEGIARFVAWYKEFYKTEAYLLI